MQKLECLSKATVTHERSQMTYPEVPWQSNADYKQSKSGQWPNPCKSPLLPQNIELLLSLISVWNYLRPITTDNPIPWCPSQLPRCFHSTYGMYLPEETFSSSHMLTWILSCKKPRTHTWLPSKRLTETWDVTTISHPIFFPETLRLNYSSQKKRKSNLQETLLIQTHGTFLRLLASYLFCPILLYYFLVWFCGYANPASDL